MKNGIMVNLDFDDFVSDDEIIAWRSSQNWAYISVLNAKAPLRKEFKRKFEGAVKMVSINAFEESIQLAFLIRNPVLGIDIINSKTTPSAVIFIHTAMKSSEVARLKKHISNKGSSVYSVAKREKLPKYNTSFQVAFDQARLDLGPNAIFEFKGKPFSTNHPGEPTPSPPSSLFKHATSEKKIKDSFVQNINSEGSVDNQQSVATNLLPEKNPMGVIPHTSAIDPEKTEPILDDSQTDVAQQLESPSKIIIGQDQNFPKYNTSFKSAFDQARLELGPSSIFSFHGKMYTTNHPWELTPTISPSLLEQSTIVELSDHPTLKAKNISLPKTVSDSELIVSSEIKEPSTKKNKRLRDDDGFFTKQINIPWINAKFQAHQNPFPIRREEWNTYNDELEIPDSTYGLDFVESWESSLPVDGYYEQSEFYDDSLFMVYYVSEIEIKSDKINVPIYVDGEFVGETPLSSPIHVSPGWHEVSSVTPHVYTLLSRYASKSKKAKGHNNTELANTRTIYAQPGGFETVTFYSKQMSAINKGKHQSGGMMIGTPMIFLMLGLISWSLG